MSSIASFLDNSIVNNTLKLFLILYAGYIYKVNSTRLHPLLNNKVFAFIFIAITIYALSRKFWFSVFITAVFYLVFHFLYYVENKNVNQSVVANDTAANTAAVANTSSPNHEKKVHFNNVAQLREYDMDSGEDHLDDFYHVENKNENNGENSDENQVLQSQFQLSDTSAEYDPGQEITLNQANHVISQNIIPGSQNAEYATIPNKFKQFIELQTKSENYMNPDVKFIDASLKRENILPYDKSNKHYVF